MSSKLFVGGLSWSMEESALQNSFEKFGEVTEAKIITDRDTGRSKGFGFVTFSKEEDADAAIRGLDGTSLDGPEGRQVKVDKAIDKRRDDRGGGGGYRSRDGYNNY